MLHGKYIMPNVVINRNPALQTSYKLIVPGLESFNYFITSAEIPGMSAGEIDSSYKNNQLKIPADRVDYDPLNVDFIVDEDFANRQQIMTWMWDFYNGADQFWSQATKNLQLVIMNSNMVPTRRVEFFNSFPISVGGIRFDSNATDTEVIHCTATFAYQNYTIVLE